MLTQPQRLTTALSNGGPPRVRKPANINLEAAALDDAVCRGAIDEVRLLLDSGVSPNACDVRGDSPLHNAAWVGAPDIVRLLLERGANPYALGEDGLNPLQRMETIVMNWHDDHPKVAGLLRAAMNLS